MSSPALAPETTDKLIVGICRVGAISAFILLVYCIEMIVQISVLGGQPSSAAEAFQLLESNKFVALLRMDLPTIFVLPLYYFLFLALSAVCFRTDGVKSILSAVLVFAGVTLALATPMALSMVPLSDKYAAATTDSARQQFLAAGEAILASDMWHSTGAYVGGLMVQVGAVLICLVMMKNRSFGKVAGSLGVAAHGIDLVHLIFMAVLPKVGAVFMMIAGPLYPVWFWFVGRDLLRVARRQA
jgi:hypothetical protein